MVEAKARYFHFTLGPVQGFVAQARRTRDFWAGSFLLSWLAGVAMAEIARQGGQITFPQPPADYLDWITGCAGEGEGPRQGAIPNRFKALMAQVPSAFEPQQVEAAVREAWVALAEHVWACDGLGKLAAPQTRAIWERQHAGFWEISWALADDATASDLLDRRKNWRSHYPVGEPGVKCMVMDGWQELSGARAPGRTARTEGSGPGATALGRFWDAVRDSGATGMATDLREGEHLCALAYTKRRFARHFGDFAHQLPSGLTLKGWALESGMPSVNYMAAVHWLEKLVRSLSTDELRALHQAAVSVSRDRDEWETRIRCLEAAWEQHHGRDRALRRELLAMDGSLFHRHVRDTPGQYGYARTAMRDFSRTLDELMRVHDLRGAPSPFYALLLMDGDSLGVHMADPARQQPISEALNTFTAGVREVVQRHHGYLIYAGGDDVLAVLPLEDALGCAAAVRASYAEAFACKAPAVRPATISAAVQFAHVKTPLTKVLRDAHRLLDDVAKHRAGRDALAVRVWVPGGMTLQWTQPWEVALERGELVIERLARQFQVQAASADDGSEANEGAAHFSSKFFHRIRERFTILNPASAEAAAVLSEDQAVQLLAVDYRNSADNRRRVSLAQARGLVAPLLSQCRPVQRLTGEPRARWPVSRSLHADGALLVHFLATKGEA